MINPVTKRPHRPQVAAIPLRQGRDGLEVMLVTSRETKRWIVPKGWPMKGRKDHRAAAIEALEEAGVRGRIRKHPVGAYTYGKRHGDQVEPCRVMVYLLDVNEVAQTWLEDDQRKRRWFTAAEAAATITEPALAQIIRRLEVDADGEKAMA